MSIAYPESGSTKIGNISPKFGPTSPATKMATSALLVFATVGTTAGVPLAVPVARIIRSVGTAHSAAKEQVHGSASDAELVKWIKGESGLTWDQIARVFDVSRRALHLWASGGRISSGNAEAIQRFGALLRQTHGATPTETRAVLLAIGDDGQSPIDRFRRSAHSAGSSINGAPFEPLALIGDSHWGEVK